MKDRGDYLLVACALVGGLAFGRTWGRIGAENAAARPEAKLRQRLALVEQGRLACREATPNEEAREECDRLARFRVEMETTDVLEKIAPSDHAGAVDVAPKP